MSTAPSAPLAPAVEPPSQPEQEESQSDPLAEGKARATPAQLAIYHNKIRLIAGILIGPILSTRLN